MKSAPRSGTPRTPRLCSSATASWARILKAVTAEARAEGLNVGLLRPVTLYPFPAAHSSAWPRTARVFVVVEMSNGQLLEDVKLALNGARPVEFLSRVGGNVPSHEEVLGFVRNLARQPAGLARRGAGGKCLANRLQSTQSSHGKAKSFYERYERKEELQHQTHFCPGCGHGVVHKMLATRHRRSWHSGPDHPCRSGRLRGLYVLLLRCRQCPGRARTRPGRGNGHQAQPPRRASSSATRATAICRPSDRRRFCMPPIAAKTSP